MVDPFPQSGSTSIERIKKVFNSKRSTYQFNALLLYGTERKRLFFHEKLKFMIKQVDKGQISTLKR